MKNVIMSNAILIKETVLNVIMTACLSKLIMVHARKAVELNHAKMMEMIVNVDVRILL